MLVKTSELSGAQLDYAVAKCEGMTDYEFPLVWLYYKDSEGDGDNQWHYSSNWSHGGPIIERERICPDYLLDGRWLAISRLDHSKQGLGPTLLIAAMRCYVASQMGDTIEIPDELLE